MKRVALLAIGPAALALCPTPLLAHGSEAAVGTVAPAVVARTTTYSALTIAPGRIPVAPEGKTLTLTVNGEEFGLAPGTYTGNVVLAVKDDIPVKFMELPTHHFRAAVYVKDGVPVPEKSVSSAVKSGEVGEREADLLRISSYGKEFNGVIADGKGTYTVDRPIIHLVGNGGDDFAGFGAALMSTGDAELIVNRPFIRTEGAVRTALFVGGNSTMRVNDAEIEVFNGTLPADYEFTVDVGKMMEVPWMLGLSGNVRASNLVGKGTLYITNSHIRAQGWGALSTDAAEVTRMYVYDSLIETLDSGYGSYSIGDSHNRFFHSIINAADIGSILAGEASITFTDGSIVNSGRYGVMMHSGQGGGTLTIDKGSTLHSKDTAIQVKGRGTNIVVDDAKVIAGNGIILQAMENDDPFLKAMMRGDAPPGMSAPPPGTEMMLPSAGPQFSPDVTGTFSNTTLTGDFYNGRTQEGAMALRFENAAVTGIISTSLVAPATGKEPTRETYQEIGHVVNTPAPTETDNGLSVSLDGKSRWTITGTSYLTGLTLEPGATVNPASGRKLSMLVNGRRTPLRPGDFKGAITLEIK